MRVIALSVVLLVAGSCVSTVTPSVASVRRPAPAAAPGHDMGAMPDPAADRL